MAQQETSLARMIAPHKAILERAKDAIAAAVPATMKKTITPERVAKIILASMGRNPKLAECTPESILTVCMASAELGLEPNSPLGHLYAVPFRDGKRGVTEATPIIGYRGFIALARRSGEIQSVESHVIYSEDEYTIAYGSDSRLIHHPRIVGKRGDIVAAYCVAAFVGGGKHIEVMTANEIGVARSRSKAKDNGPWKSDYAEMCRKTVVRRAAKYWPLSTEMSRAIEIDDAQVVDAAETLHETARETLPPPCPTAKSDELKGLLQEGDNA